MEREKLLYEMIKHNAGDPHQIQHFLKVHSFSRWIGREEDLDEKTLEILEVAAIVHDVGIKTSLEKYGDSNGKNQEKEGPPIAERILKKLRYPQDVIDRVSYLVGHHHTYNEIDGMDYQILVEADFLVNMHEGNMNKETIAKVLNKVFKTETGKDLCRVMFEISENKE